MQLSTFTADRLDEALQMVQRALGPNAWIVSSDRVPFANGVRYTVRALPEGATPESDAFTKLCVGYGIADEVCRQLSERCPPVGHPSARLESAIASTCAFARPTNRVVVFVGPTGTGKTTSIAKIATVEALTRNRKVALISTDGYRIGGSDQLAMYADLIGIPFEFASDATSYSRALRLHASADLILVDTPGRGPREHETPSTLSDVLQVSAQEHAVVFCTNAHLRDADADLIAAAYKRYRPAHLLPTKLDECASLGGVVNQAVRFGLPLAWLCTGQRVPEDIEDASAEALSQWLRTSSAPARGDRRISERRLVDPRGTGSSAIQEGPIS